MPHSTPRLRDNRGRFVKVVQAKPLPPWYQPLRDRWTATVVTRPENVLELPQIVNVVDVCDVD